MCGIVGVFNLEGGRFEHDDLKRMTDTLRHRGPDGEGYFIDDGIAFGHRRLAILDLSPAGAQPMRSKNGEWVIIFNGCVYNFRELREELLSLGHTFVSTSDTEVIVEGLAQYGAVFFERLNGMFAVGAWNTIEKRLYLSRDRFGVKPLYYWFTGKTLVFASEIKAIIAHPQFKVDLDYGALNEYFTFQNLFTYRTLFRGVHQLPQANTLAIDSRTRTITHSSWWDYDFSSTDDRITMDEAVTETRRLLKDAVLRQMVSDVPVGAYLSGGMDSGSITAIATSRIERLTTFTCGFDMNDVTGVEVNYDERRDAELMANYFKTEHYEQVLNAGDLRWSLPRVVYHLEDLRVGMSYPNYYISRLASKFVKVCLQGTGGDELYGGYPWRYYRAINALDKRDFFEQYYDFWQRLVPDSERNLLFTDAASRHVDFAEPRAIFEKVFTFNDRLRYDSPEHQIANSLYFEIKTFLAGLLLVGDKLAMANGLEERFPFLDNDLVEYAQRIPVTHKLGDFGRISRIDENMFVNKRKFYHETHAGKDVLRQAMRGFIPEKILSRNKQGFSAPDESWYRGENAAYIKELLLDRQTICSEFINKQYIQKIVNEHIDEKINHRLLIWSFMNFEWWCRIFLNKEQIEL